MATGHYNVTSRAGEVCERTLLDIVNDGVTMDLSGYSARLIIADGPALLANVPCTVGETSVAWHFTPSFAPGNYIYSLQLIEPEGATWDLLAGDFILYPSPSVLEGAL